MEAVCPEPCVGDKEASAMQLTAGDTALGGTNPADLPSRGLAPLDLSVSELWCNGPSWLTHGKIEEGNQEAIITEECQPC